MYALCWQADPTPSLLQVPTPSLNKPPAITKELDGSIYGPGQLSLLYVPGIDPPHVWEEEDAASIKTQALDLPSGLMHIYDLGLFTGASWLRRTPWGPWLTLGSDSKSARKVDLPPSWLKSLPVPLDLRTSLPDRLLLYSPLPYQSPFDVSRYFVPSELLKPLPPP